MSAAPEPGSGYRLLPHTADLIVEAYGVSLRDCFRAAVAGMTASFVDTTGVAPTGAARVELTAPNDEALLVAVLEEVIFLLDTADAIVVDAHFDDVGSGVARGHFDTADKTSARAVGSAPKAVAYHDLELSGDDAGHRCRFLLDV